MTIPRLIHRVWPGKDPIPDEYESFWAGFLELHPDWVCCTWRDLVTGMKNKKLWDEAQERSPKWKSWRAHEPTDYLRFRSCILRLEVLRMFGGVYVDTDVEPLRSLEPLRELGCFATPSKDRGDVVSDAVIGAEPGHPYLSHLVETLERSSDEHAGERIVNQVGPRHLTREIGGFEVEVLRLEAFAPTSYEEARRHGSYGWHHWRNRTEP